MRCFGRPRDGLSLSFFVDVYVCPFSLSRSPHRSRFVSLFLSSLLFFLVSSIFSLSLSLSLSLSSFPLSGLSRSSRFRSPLALTLFRGRRQLPQAGEVRRPRGPAWRACGWRQSSGSCGFETRRKTRQEREGAEPVQVHSPRPPGSFRSRRVAKMVGPGEWK